MNCIECTKLQKRIKVMESDHEFQLRKLGQDKAEEKALFELGMQKDMRKWQQKYNKQRSEHEENNKKWLNKVDQTNNQCQLAIEELRRLTHLSIQKERTQTNNHCQAQISDLTAKNQLQLNRLKHSHNEELQRLQKAQQNKIEALQKRYENQIEKLKLKANQSEDALKRDYQLKLDALKHEKGLEQRQNEKLQQEFRRQRSRYLSQIYDQRLLINSLEETVKNLKASIYAKEQEIARKQTQIAQLHQNHQIERMSVQKQQQNMRKDFQQAILKQTRLFFEKELEITNKYQESVKSIEEKRQYEQRLFQTNLQEIRNCIDNRPSRVEDVDQINVIRQRLSKKEKEYELLERQVKHYQLELENKEDTYNKLFIPSVNSTNLNESNNIKKKDLRVKRAGKSVSNVRDILGAVSPHTGNNLPILISIDKKMLPPKSIKIL